ncbi:MAG: glycoside hydrolase family 3 N-terminal domain-containing protein, partial [Paracoccaceae bacterium]
MTNFGACILSCDGPRLSADETALFKEIRPFGFILFARHIESVSQVRALCDELRATVERDCIITIDQEGGRVQRLRGPTWRDWQPPLEHIATASESVRAMFLRARVIAHELHGLGIDSNCIPTLDVIQPNTHPFLVNRCYGETVDGVIAAGRATAEGLLAGGIVPVMKHIPGHGRSQFDTHFDVPTVLTDRAALEAVDFAPFAALR